ncbi:MAG TPA: tetratricopeptide repeat protein [Acidiferrobacterales bacterium]|nr:tetratricopeptide repeat protein [Acidiferrobacterales bacterium]
MKLSTLTIALLAALLTACQAISARPEAAADIATSEKQALPSMPLAPDVLYQLLLGEIAGHRGQLDVSVSALSRAARKTRDPRLAERATLAALYARQPVDALPNALLWVELKPQSSEAHEALAAALMETGKPAEAQQHFEKLIALGGEAGLAQSYLRIAATLGRQSNRTDALEVMRALAQRHPDKAVAHYALAHLAVRVSDLDTATTAIERALAISPAWEDAALFKARVLVSQKDMPKVLQFYERYLDSYPRAGNMRLGYARHLVDLKQWDKAREQFKRVVADAPRDAEAMFTIALLALQSNELDEAERYLKRTLDVQPENDQARLYLGQVAEQRKQYDDAIQWYSSIESAEMHFEAQARLGVALARQGNVDQARAHLHNLVPKTEAQKVQLALAEEQMLRDAKRHSEAFDVLTRTLGELPDNVDLLYARALVAEKLNRIEVAEKDLRRILKKDPKNPNALNALGYTLADRTTRYTEALALIEQALALKPDDPFILDSLGWAHYRLGNHAEAVRHLRAAFDKRADAEIAAHLGEVLWVTGDRTGAESVWKRALQQSPDSEELLGVISKFRGK